MNDTEIKKIQSKNRPGKPAESTQKYLSIAEIKDGAIVMKDRSLRAVIAVSSTNYALKSEEEQNALTAAYQGFLNSLDFPIQVLIHSRVLDINNYLENLRTQSINQTNELLRIQTAEYIEYVGKLVDFASIMSKNFYVVVPYYAGNVKETFTGKFLRFLNPAANIAGKEEKFEHAKIKLDERSGHVVSALGGMGLRSFVLNTEELIELVYQSYNFDTASSFHGSEMQDLQIDEGK